MANVPQYINREDKLISQLESAASGFLFDQLSTDYLSQMGLEYLAGVEIPFKPEDLVASKTGGMPLTSIADNMVKMLGINPSFAHRDGYIKFLATFFNEDLIDAICSKGQEALVSEQFHTAAIYFRAALVLAHDNERAMFSYACCCREWYLSYEGEEEFTELIKTLKAESTEYFEYCVINYPDSAPAYYYLGFAYLNASLYSKARIIWTKYLGLCDKDTEQYKEIEGYLPELEQASLIEGGINHILAGRYEEGLKVLEPYLQTQYNGWWPLHYYLASAYRALGHIPEAIEGFKQVIKLAPSNYDANLALAELYEEAGETELAAKYQKKSELIASNN